MSSAARGNNFSELEKSRLLDLVETYSNVIENKRTDATTCHEKMKAWEGISVAFNSTETNAVRTWKQLKNCYENMKRRAKKNAADEKIERYKTGGGSCHTQLTSQEERLIGMVKDQFNSLRNPADSDASFSGDKDVSAEGDIFEIMETITDKDEETTTEIPLTPNNAPYDFTQQPTESNRASTSKISSCNPPSHKRKAEEEVATMANKKTILINRQLEILEQQHKIKMEILKNELKNSVLALENQQIETEIKKATLAKLMANK
ncbi:myb/SANT-like DNA-binding domain-containing protein 3 [Ischnura elegans]|uniref:myb/SANT-like DNA-binding domain-containing protein 3 n=1 Tax=Ischnura elegans TaxID=197161 RepID=UPI001ED88E88|nr:myb/SANT-like DNA-binding domain-containing protein 3 [Ischnura elegans]